MVLDTGEGVRGRGRGGRKSGFLKEIVELRVVEAEKVQV